MFVRQQLVSDFLLGCFFEGEGGGGDPSAPPTPPADPSATPKTYDEEYVKGLRAEAASNRKKATELEAKQKAIDDANLTEAEKLKKRADDAEAKVTASQKRIARSEFKAEAADKGFINPERAYKLIADDIEFDAEGEPTNIGKLVEGLVKSDPYLLKQEGGGGGSPANPAGGRGGQGSKFDPKNPPPWKFKQ